VGLGVAAMTVVKVAAAKEVVALAAVETAEGTRVAGAVVEREAKTAADAACNMCTPVQGDSGSVPPGGSSLLRTLR
jgi:hypothetical protein